MELGLQPQSRPIPLPEHWSRSSGKERDSETGLDYFGARYFGSNLGRFMSPDWTNYPEPLAYGSSLDPQSLNLYSYGKDNPLLLIDLDGHRLVIAPKLQAVVSQLRQESTAFDAELAAHDGNDKPDLIIDIGPTPNDPNGDPTNGSTNTKFDVLQGGPGHMEIGDEESNEYKYKSSTVVLSPNSTEPQDEVLEHEIGHVHHNRTNPTRSARDSNHTARTHGATPWGQRPEERRANAFRNWVKQQREAKKKEDKRREQERKRREKIERKHEKQ